MNRLSRARQLRRNGRDLARSGSHAALQVARHAPVPDPVRRTLQTHVLWTRETRFVPVDRILLGSQNGMSGAAWAAATDDPLWPSRRVADGPHAQLLRRATEGPLSDEDILQSTYAGMARDCIRQTGDFFGASDDRGIVSVARTRLDPSGGTTSLPRQSKPDRPILLAPIRDSDCYQVVDGHHRVAELALAGQRLVPALVRRVPESTPLQDLLDRMSWIGGERELYQPVSSPELERSWRTVRHCTDRFEAMRSFLDRLDLGGTHLDVASCYGWFVAGMTSIGFESEGVEQDRLAPRLGEMVYGLDPTRITVADAVSFLEGHERRRWDVVTCFSLLHHFVLGRGSVTAAQLVRLLGRATGTVLFLDTGQAHERWFRDRLPEWDAAYVADFLRRHGGFDTVHDLGPDHDGVPPYDGNYGRHLFAAVRH